MLHRLTSGFVIRGFLAAAAAMIVSLPDTASALPRDRIAARRLARILPPGSTLTLPATPVPPRRPAIVRTPAIPAAPRAVAAPSPRPAAPQTAAKTAAATPQPATTAAAKPAQQPAAASGVQQAAGTAPATKTATPTGAWTLDDDPAADGTKSVLVPSGPQPTPAAPIELLPTP
jgi:hypothetical protein